MKLIICTMQRQAPNPHSCGNGGGLEVASKLEQEIVAAGLCVSLERKACLGICLKGPNVQLLPEGKFWHGVSIRDMGEIVAYLKQRVEKP